MKRYLTGLLTLAALSLVAAAIASAAAPKSATVAIRHRVQHCHSWALDNGSYTAAVTGTLAKNGTITFTNNDLMAHTLIQESGPKAIFLGKPLLNRPGASIAVRLSGAGVYVFGTKEGADYIKNLKTVGADNILRLTITVS